MGLGNLLGRSFRGGSMTGKAAARALAKIQTAVDASGKVLDGLTIEDVEGLPLALSQREPLGAAAAAVVAHESKVDPHPGQYATAAGVAAAVDGHAGRTDNPHGVTAEQVRAERIFPAVVYGAVGDGVADDGVAIQAAIDAAAASVVGLSFGWATGEEQAMAVVVVAPGIFRTTTQIIIKRGVVLRCLGIIRNDLAGSFAHPIVVQAFGAIDQVRLDCQGKQGILAGAANVGVGIRLAQITVANCGSTFAWPDWHAALDVRGFNFDIRQVWLWGGYYGLRLGDASDVRLWDCIAIDAQKGVYLVNVNHSTLLGVDVDTHRQKGLVIDMARGVRIDCHIWFNDAVGATETPTHGIHLGEWTAPTWRSHGVDITATLMNCGAIGCEIWQTEQASVRLACSRGDLFTGTAKPITTAIVYGDDNSFPHVEAAVDVDIPTDYSGFVVGTAIIRKGTTVTAVGTLTAFLLNVPTGAINAPSYQAGGVQVLGEQESVGAALGAATAGATYGATEQAMLQAVHAKLVALETALRNHGAVVD